MAATKEQIGRWFDEGVAQGASHMVVICDTFSYDDHPVFCNSSAEARSKAGNPGPMQKTMEVYCLAGDKQKQLDQAHCWQLDAAGTAPRPARYEFVEVTAELLGDPAALGAVVAETFEEHQLRPGDRVLVQLMRPLSEED